MAFFEKDLQGDLKKIAEVAGMEAAMKIGRAFKGTYLYISGFEQLKKKVRDEEIRRAYGEGVKVRLLCLRHGLTERQIRRILCEAEHELPGSLLDLIRD
jgi:Mor family transcriptional regulator